MQLASTVMPGILNNDNYFCLMGSFFHHIITSVPSEYFTVTPNVICWSLMNSACKRFAGMFVGASKIIIIRAVLSCTFLWL